MSSEAFQETVAQGLVSTVNGGTGIDTSGSTGIPSINAGVWSIVTPPLTKAFASSQQTITAAGALTIAHGLGAVPILVQFELVNTSTELNYSANDIYKGTFMDEGNSNKGVSVVVDATDLVIRFASGASTFSVPDKTTGGMAGITNSKWKIVFRAFV